MLPIVVSIILELGIGTRERGIVCWLRIPVGVRILIRVLIFWGGGGLVHPVPEVVSSVAFSCYVVL
jgi:hypothetical protein